ncbi:hypothetical protein BO99DRAFT_408369 [Aspergillus violaceofuscus CBS 115571]|uniref:Uncharacterized protein n=1 Tax=Aspergillus violaceofuscus (strain CBS 115571) TaxID=1450538 RepID=A0A2V5IKA4_ASPV1|nr:hypothetical protein BO99DRAFT_408369 [Aspergillus violaceofuscus CBS 115571]
MPLTFQAAPAIKYTSLDESSKPDGPTSLSERLKKHSSTLRDNWRDALIICLSILCAGLLLDRTLSPTNTEAPEPILAYGPCLQASSPGLNPAEPSLTPKHKPGADPRWVQYHWTTGIYSAPHPEQADRVHQAWAAIVPAYGFVAVDHLWAAQHHLPASMSLPSNSSKGVYILDAYHRIHCLTIIRRTLREILETGHPPPGLPLQHAWHCFDSLLQYIVCGNTGDTLLYTWGRNQTGDGQVRKCVDWRGRKEWIRRRTACYRDTETPVRLVDHFTGCNDGDEAGDDGIRLDMW